MGGVFARHCVSIRSTFIIFFHFALYSFQILWNDPVNASEYERQLAELREQNCQSILERLPIGYVQNIKRATAFYYSPLAVDNFLNENGLSHVIRAHEV